MRLAIAVIALLPSIAHAQSPDTSCSTPTYLPRGDRWVIDPIITGTSGVPEPVVYRLSAAGSDDVPLQTVKEVLDRAVGQWNAPGCASGTPNIRLARGVDYPAADGGADDNVIYWVESGWQDDSQTIALTTNYHVRDTGFMLSADMKFNGQHFRFRAKGDDGVMRGCAASGSGAQTCFDLEVVALHELGHFFGFDHVPCADAVMFPSATPASVVTQLSEHERTGVCAVYRPRLATTQQDFGEVCTTDAECAGAGAICIVAVGGNVGWCTRSCSDDQDCAAAYVCARAENGRSFCKPGPHETGIDLPPDHPSDVPLDLCAPCTSGDQCSNGYCVSDGREGGTSLCTMACRPPQALCPVGMSCVETSSGAGVCWPELGTQCPTDPRAKLNEICFDATAGSYTPCGPDLVCFAFVDRPEGRLGACVTYCNDSDVLCPDINQTCCYAVDGLGNCVTTPPAGPHHGGCFDLRREGEACVTAENSICEQGSGCFTFGSTNQSKCYRLCNGAACGDGQSCLTFTLSSGAAYALCCNDGTGRDGQPACEATKRQDVYDVGVACTRNEDCDAGLCLTYDGKQACSRSCNPVTLYGCPGDIDVNGDGSADGGFTCRALQGRGYCWPKAGPISPTGTTRYELPGGCCNALGRPATATDAGEAVMLWGAIVALGLQRRRRARL